LAEDVLTLLRTERPGLDALTAQMDAPPAAFGSPIATVGAAAAALFLLRSHIKIIRSAAGKWTFKFEHKPADNDLLKKVLDALKGVLKG